MAQFQHLIDRQPPPLCPVPFEYSSVSDCWCLKTKFLSLACCLWKPRYSEVISFQHAYTIYNTIMSVSPRTITELVTYHLGNKNNQPSCNFKHFKIIRPENTKEVFKNNYDMFSLHIYSFLFSSSPFGYLGYLVSRIWPHTCSVSWLFHATVRYRW